MIYKEWLKEWMENYIVPVSKEKTVMYYTVIVEKHLIPDIGDMEMEELTPIILQRYVTELLNSGNLRTGGGLSSNTVNSIITVMQNSLRQAYELGIIFNYVADKIRRPKTKEKRIECFTADEQQKIEAAIVKSGKLHMIGVILSLYSGLRIGELLALEWRDIDFVMGEITVSKTCHDGKRDGRYCRIIESPKTENSKRIIPLPKQIIPKLVEVRLKNRSKYVIGIGDKIITVRGYQYLFSNLLKYLEITHRGFHALRHTFATRALECGMDVKTLSEILGHKNATVTLNRYAHSLTSHKHEMMDKLGELHLLP